MWSIRNIVVAINEWKARIVHASISKQCIFCLPNTSESIKHKIMGRHSSTEGMEVGHGHYAQVL